MAGGHVRQGDVAIKDLVKELGTLPAPDKCAPERATEGGGDEPSDSDSSTPSSESSGSSLDFAGCDAAAKKSDVGKRTVGTHLGKRGVRTFVVGVKSIVGRQPRGGGGKRKRGPVGAPAPKSMERRSDGGCVTWAVPYVSTALYRVARRWCWVVARSRVVPPLGAVFVGVAPKGLRAPLVVPKRCRSGGRGPNALRGESAGGGAGAGGMAWKFKPRGED